MRTFAYVLVFGLIVAAIATISRWLPFSSIPLMSSLVGVHLGLSTKRKPVRAILAAVVVGYVSDLIQGNPAGLCALSSGLVALIFYSVQSRLLVRGWLFSSSLGFLGASIAGVVMALFRHGIGAGPPSSGYVLTIFWVALSSAVIAPMVFAICRQIDAKFVRTQRERQLALGGVLPL